MQRKVQFIKDLKKEDIVNDIFVVKFKKPVDKYKNGFKFELRLGDSSKEIMFKYWGSDNQSEVEELYKSIKKDDFVRIQGRINEWNNNLEISSNSKVIIIPSEEIDLADFIPKSKRDIEEMYSELKKYLDSIQNEDLKKFVDYLLSDEKFVSDFKKSPAAMYKHHGWIGGLLEHTLSVVKISVNALDIYPQLDKDLVIAGAFIHDIGKIEEFKVTSSIKVSEEGMLLGHISIGLEKLSKILDKLEINPVIKLKLKHIILSHHGNLEYGSPKLPAFPEAMLIYHADDMDAKLNLMTRTKEEALTEDDYVYTRDFGNIYLK
jgi:3'-5' exoribonuclease